MPPSVPSPQSAAASPPAPVTEPVGVARASGGVAGEPVGALATPISDTWVELVADALPTGVEDWVVEPRCGAVVSFRGTVRDHAEGRAGVEALTYEAYESAAVARMDELAHEARRRWPGVGRLAVLHRVGELAVGDVAVLVVVAAPHRDEAFEVGRWLIDAVKASVPIWKRERWAGGDDWGTGAQPLVAPADVPVLLIAPGAASVSGGAA